MGRFKMHTSYNELLNKSTNPSKAEVMLSELIDNSIGSAQKEGTLNNLEILLEINAINMNIICNDNANGMNKEELGNSVRLTKPISGNKMNMYGVGMKNCAFWFGKDLKIESNKNGKSFQTSVYISELSEKEKEKGVEWDVSSGKRKNNGTTITISKIYAKNMIPNQKTIDNYIKDFWSPKYTRYIKKGVIIKIKYVDKLGKEYTNYIEENIVPTQIIPKDKIDKFIELLNKNNDVPKILKGIKEMAIEKAEKEQELIFDFRIPWDSMDNKILEFTLGIQKQIKKTNNESKDYKRFYGITTFQNDRGINVAPMNPLQLGEYIRTSIKRTYGFIELGNIFKPDNNKQDFIFGNEEYGNLNEEFKTLLKKIGVDLSIISDIVHNLIGSEVIVKDEKNNPHASKQLSNALNTKTNAEWTITPNGGDINFWNVNGLDIKIIQVSCTNSDDKNYFIHAENIDGDINKILITYNTNHQIWKPISNNNSTIDVKTVLYPLIAIIGISHLAIKFPKIANKMGCLDSSKSYLEIMNQITKVVIK